jgi:hypothetical protein
LVACGSFPSCEFPSVRTGVELLAGSLLVILSSGFSTDILQVEKTVLTDGDKMEQDKNLVNASLCNDVIHRKT